MLARRGGRESEKGISAGAWSVSTGAGCIDRRESSRERSPPAPRTANHLLAHRPGEHRSQRPPNPAGVGPGEIGPGDQRVGSTSGRCGTVIGTTVQPLVAAKVPATGAILGVAFFVRAIVAAVVWAAIVLLCFITMSRQLPLARASPGLVRERAASASQIAQETALRGRVCGLALSPQDDEAFPAASQGSAEEPRRHQRCSDGDSAR